MKYLLYLFAVKKTVGNEIVFCMPSVGLDCPNNQKEAMINKYSKKEMSKTFVSKGKVMVEKVVIETKNGQKTKRVYLNGKLGR